MNGYNALSQRLLPQPARPFLGLRPNISRALTATGKAAATLGVVAMAAGGSPPPLG